MREGLTEDDTFRILSRLPINEASELIFKRVVLHSDMGESEFTRIVESYGYTLEEYYDYERANT
jgi:hypothetical protein